MNTHQIRTIGMRIVRVTTLLKFRLLHHRAYTYIGSAIILSSMQKSGTNYLRLLISNYLYILHSNDISNKLDYDAVQHSFPNVRSYVLSGKENIAYSRSFISLDTVGYTDFIYDHGCFSESLNLRMNFVFKSLLGKKTIYLYRNPYDNLISMYYYKFGNRVGSKSSYSHPRELIKDFIPQFCRRYMVQKALAAQAGALMISYEELIRDPVSTLRRLLNHLDLSFDESAAKVALESSSIKSVKAMEKKRGKAIHSPKEGLTGSFIRSGQIGQWKEYFSAQDLIEIKAIINSYSISIDDFIIE
jgi:hypothetical protein